MISAEKFYGGNKKLILPSSFNRPKSPVPYKIPGLNVGPPTTWRVFRKQLDALNFAREKGFGLMTFAFETDDSRLFLVAHPQVFWHYDTQRPCSQRSSYEVIPELAACKLYFDLEFDIPNNPNANGYSMVETFIRVVSYFLSFTFGVNVQSADVLILDSTSANVKFSVHLIFNIPLVVFQNNYEMGAFVHFICQEITSSVEDSSLTESLSASGLNLEQLMSLIVKDKKGKSTIFCDECVYSKNRHFRLFGSSKKGKNTPLLFRNLLELNLPDEKIFLNSLITFVDVSESLRVLDFTSNKLYKPIRFETNGSKPISLSDRTKSTVSPFPEVDKFINRLVSPGKIYRSVYFASTNTIVFDIVGYRYCGNIGRAHKSNNIKYIVDLTSREYYQKCHDFECSNYKSEKMGLPYELCFLLSDNSDIMETDDPGSLGSFGISNEDLEGVLDLIENIESAFV